ncbi:nucleotide disphospho-sugar-binding domain-containing protein [Clostridium sp. IBUN22A]|uniref:glycosyltransferase n=1 Tax=Clostridium sp. IBUN22A TaxID=1523155 RepID=UPI0005FAE1A3|nr:nucleotide disphospho-sugar-binding domain-containing protein [Clostridium sp. IBUN22A]
MRKLRIVFSSMICDAGEVTRALELAEGIRQYCPLEYDAEIIFTSNGSRFEDKIISSGFSIYKCSPVLPGIGFHQDMKPTDVDIIGDVNLVTEMLKGEIKAFNDLKPHIVIHGFYPIASLARRMMDEKILGICYIPLPLSKEMLESSMIRDIPDNIRPFSYLPKTMRKILVRIIPKSLKSKSPTLKQRNIIEGLKKFNWNDEPVNNLFDMLKSDFTIVNDFNEFYNNVNLPENFKITGPLYATGRYNEIDKKILDVFNNDNNRLKIFCTLGSSGKKQYLTEVLKCLTTGIGMNWSAVILAPPSVCDINEIKFYEEINKNIYITDKFISAPAVNELANLVISHGGQGTLQTAIASRTPVVGYGMQMEQQINIDNLEAFGSAIRIPIHKWKAENIQKAVIKIVGDPLYRRNAEKLSEILKNTDGKKNAAEAVWNFILKNYHI